MLVVIVFNSLNSDILTQLVVVGLFIAARKAVRGFLYMISPYFFCLPETFTGLRLPLLHSLVCMFA